MTEMTMKTSLLFLYTEAPLHVGTGASVSAVDLPIQRERTTGHPIVPGSGVKGALRNQTPEEPMKVVAFGPDTDSAHEHAGAVAVGEAHVVLFPVRSLAGVFAYVTCPLALARLYRDLELAGIAPKWQVPSVAESSALVTQNSMVTAGNKVVLEEFTFTATGSKEVDDIASWLAANTLPTGNEYAFWRAKLQNSLVILPDNDFRDFVVSSTEVTTHVRLVPDTKTVASGALWTEEALPADVLLACTVVARRSRKEGQSYSADDISKWVRDSLPGRLQLGGNETTGEGIVAHRWLEGA